MAGMAASIMPHHQPLWNEAAGGFDDDPGGGEAFVETESSMRVMGESEDHHQQQQHMVIHSGSDNNSTRGSLGQYIERSTSAPPSSSDNGGDSLFGGSKLLAPHHQQQQVTALALSTSISSGELFRPASSVIDSTAATPVIGNPPYGENPAPENEAFRAAVLSSMIDSSGRATAPSVATAATAAAFIGGASGSATASEASTANRNLASYNGFGPSEAASSSAVAGARTAGGGGGSLGNSNMETLIGHDSFKRSHSAAPPTSLGPPPGLPALDSSKQPLQPRGQRGIALHRPASDVIQRPASTGLLESSSASALRPSAKTLMDLIQEDYPPEESPTPPAQQDVYFGSSNAGGKDIATFSDNFNQLSSPTTASTTTATTPESINAQPQTYVHQTQQLDAQFLSQQQQQQQQQLLQQQLPVDQLQQQVQQLRLDPATGTTRMVSVGAHEAALGGGVVLQQHQSLQQTSGQVMATRYVPTGFDGRESAPAPDSSLYPQVSAPAQQQQPPQQQQQQVYVSTPGRPPQPGTIVTGPDGQQQIYYQQQQQIEVPAPQTTRLQAQVLPNGQTVYVQAPSPPSQPPAPGYAYTTIQYQGEQGVQQQTRLVSTAPATMIRQSDGTYISAVPIQANTPPPQQQQQQQQQQVTYWQTDAQGQTVLMGGPGVGIQPQSLVNQVASPTQQQQPGTMDHHLHQQQQQQFGPQAGLHQQRHNQQHGGPAYGRGGREKSMGTPTGGVGNGGSNGRSRRGGHQSRRGGAEPKGHAASSPLLEEFRSNKNRPWTVAQIEGHIVEFCQDQNGSRFIQQRLELGDRLEQDIVVREVLPSIRRLRNDVFGNYVVQKLLDFGTPQVRAGIRDTLEGEMLQLSLQMYGCRVVQKALEALGDEDLARLLTEFYHNVLSCIHDQNGNHVVQKCIEVFNSRAKTAEAQGDFEKACHCRERIDFIINDILVNATTLSCHPFGCRVLQRILEHSDETRKGKLLDEVKKSHKRLLDDQYGNYVIQHVLQYGRVEDRDSILAIVVHNGLLSLSRQKFASNVVEKLLKYGNGAQRKAIAREMLKKADEPSAMNPSGEGGTSVVLLMVRDAYANYVCQTCLDVVPDSEERTLLLNELKLHSEELRNYTFAKHIVAKLTVLDETTQ